MLEVGTRAPDFTLTRTIGQDPVRLSAYEGERPVVLLFFPLAFSGVCTDEICRVADGFSEWQTLDAEVIGISVDSAFVNTRFAQETGATFPLLSDFNKEVSTAYGVLNDDFFGMRGVSDRSAFVVDTEGVIRFAWTTADADVLPPFDDIKRAIADLKQS